MNSLNFVTFCFVIFIGMVNSFTVYRNSTGVRQQIFGGHLINIRDVPYNVILLRNGKPKCGGSLVTYNHVLTAAHCVLKKKLRGKDSLKIIAGTDKINSGGIEVLVSRVTIHTKYSTKSPFPNDIAVLELSETLPKTKKIAPVKLATRPIKDNEYVRIVGFGHFNENSKMSPYLKSYFARIISFDRCKKKIARLERNMMCDWIESGTGVCKGDSGAPLVNEDEELVGIHSGSIECAKGKPNTDTDVYSHLKFIKKHIY